MSSTNDLRLLHKPPKLAKKLCVGSTRRHHMSRPLYGPPGCEERGSHVNCHSSPPVLSRCPYIVQLMSYCKPECYWYTARKPGITISGLYSLSLLASPMPVPGTLLSPNGSISNITGWNLVDPDPGDFPRLFHWQKIRKSPKWVPEIQGCVISGEKKMPGNRGLSSELVFNRKSQIQRILTKRVHFSEKVREAKWRHKFPLSNANLLFFFHEIYSFWRKSQHKSVFI